MAAVEEALVIGADGSIGQALVRELKVRGHTVWETTRRRDTLTSRRAFLDLAENVSDWRPDGQPSCAYLCAARTSLADCKTAPEETARVNVQNTVSVAQRLLSLGAKVVFLSTNLVYDGSGPFVSLELPPSPRTEYGSQKAEAERRMLDSGGDVCVVRLTKVLDSGLELIKGWIEALRNGETIRPFSDMVFAPVPLTFVVEVLCQVGVSGATGIIQISGDRDLSYADAARHIAARMGARSSLVQPIASEESGMSLGAVPQNTTLDTARLTEELGLVPPEVLDVIDSAFGLAT